MPGPRRCRHQAVLRNLSRPARAESAPVLLDGLRRPEPHVREGACRALGHLLAVGRTPPSAVPALRAALARGPDEVRIAAIDPLGHAPGPRPDLVDLLRPVLDHDDLLVSTTAAGAVWRLEGDPVRVLAAAPLAADIGGAAVRVGDPVLQVLLVEVLTAMGPDAAPARPDLLRIRDTFTGQRGLIANERDLGGRIRVALAVIEGR